jgi:hypothetical protein
VPGEAISAQATGAAGGKRFCKISAPRVGGGLSGGTSRVTTSGPGYGANTLSTDTRDLPQIIACSVSGEAVLGVCGWDLATGDVGKVYTRGHGNVVPIIAGAAITAGNEVQTDATGAAIPLSAGKAVGYALDSAASGASCEILVY